MGFVFQSVMHLSQQACILSKKWKCQKGKKKLIIAANAHNFVGIKPVLTL